MVVEDAYARACARARPLREFSCGLAAVAEENASHVAAVYAFARSADDFADEGDRPAAERLALLDSWEFRLHQAADSPAPERGPSPRPGEPSNAVDIFIALGESIRLLSLPVAVLRRSAQRVPPGRHPDALTGPGT